MVEDCWVVLFVEIVKGSVVKKGGHLILNLIECLLNKVGRGGDEGVDLTVEALADFEENNVAAADDLVDDEG